MIKYNLKKFINNIKYELLLHNYIMNFFIYRFSKKYIYFLIFNICYYYKYFIHIKIIK